MFVTFVKLFLGHALIKVIYVEDLKTVKELKPTFLGS